MPGPAEYLAERSAQQRPGRRLLAVPSAGPDRMEHARVPSWPAAASPPPAVLAKVPGSARPRKQFRTRQNEQRAAVAGQRLHRGAEYETSASGITAGIRNDPFPINAITAPKPARSVPVHF